MKNSSFCFYLCFNLSIVSQAGRFLSVPCYPTPWKWRNHSDFSGEPGEGKGWEQAVLYLPFPGGLLMVWGGSLSTQVSFHVNLFAQLQAFCNIVLNTAGGKKFKYLFDLQHLLCCYTEERSIRELSLGGARGCIAQKLNRSCSSEFSFWVSEGWMTQPGLEMKIIANNSAVWKFS